ncbi:MAG: hypothetical protein NC127_08685 [Muribaculum sp.]|nr:hypothetical protein [Muribaculum sp.]
MNLRYVDEEDKCYGITGMAISLVIWDSEEMIAAVRLDAEPDGVMEFVPEYYFSGNPRLSAKTAWTHILQHYQASMGMALGNVLCRKYVLHGQSLDPADRDALKKCFEEEGRETCSLEPDEVDRMFDKSYSYLHKVFSHAGVGAIAHDFARILRERREMSRAEVVEHLRALSML